jgi:hypothetical protein
MDYWQLWKKQVINFFSTTAMNRYYLLFVALLLGHVASASHLLGGYISAKSLPEGANYQQITINLTLDETTGAVASADQNTVVVCFGDGTSGTATRVSRTASVPNPGMSLNLYRVNHVYPGATRYTLTASVLTRAGAVNVSGNSSPLTDHVDYRLVGQQHARVASAIEELQPGGKSGFLWLPERHRCRWRQPGLPVVRAIDRESGLFRIP